MPSGSRPAWCVAASLPRAERRAHAELHRRGFEAYLPLVTIRTPKREYRTKPLFDGYLFVRLDLAKPWHPVIYCPGVFNLVSFDGKPATCSDAAVEAVRSAVDGAGAFSAPSDAWKPGTPCSLALGPLAGTSAVVLAVSRETARVAALMLGHLTTITVPLDALQLRSD